MKIEIVYPLEKYLSGFYSTLSAVAMEKIYIETIEVPPFESISASQRELIANNGAVYYALNGDQVVGWCDVFPAINPRHSHRGELGMGVLQAYRGKGIGSKLLNAVLDHAKRSGLEKVELSVYTTNTAAIALYGRFGFEREGLIKSYRKLDNQYFDCLMMAKFL